MEAFRDNPALAAQARVNLPALRNRATLPAGRAGVEQVISPAFVLYPQPKDRGDAEWGAWWALYVEALGDLPVAAIAAAMRVWVKLPGSQYLPKPGELRELALKTPNEPALMYDRARRLIAEADRRDRERWDGQLRLAAPFVRDTRETIDRAMAGQREWVERMRTKPSKPQLPPIHGRLAPGMGITPELMALRARQLEEMA